MGVPEVFTHWVRPPVVLEENDGMSITEQSGFISTEVQVERMILAGQRLDTARKEEFDAESLEDLTEEQIAVQARLRRPGAEVMDLAVELEALSTRLAAAARAGKLEGSAESGGQAVPGGNSGLGSASGLHDEVTERAAQK